MKAMLLAAGRGMRLRPLSDSIPKPLLSVGGMPLIVRHIRRLADAGLNDIVINVSHLGGKIISALGDGNRYGAQIRYSIEPNPLEVGGGIIRALPLLGDDSFLAVNADIFCDCDFSRFYPPPPLPFGESVFAHLMLVPNPPHNSAGDFMLGDDGRILPPPPSSRKDSNATLTFSGIAIYHPQFFAEAKPQKNSELKLLPLLLRGISKGQVTGEKYSGEWRDLGTLDRVAELRLTLNQR